MIVIAEDETLIVVQQTDHAHLSAELLALWRTGDLLDHPRREEILFAAREHDNGWREEDAAPRLNRETGGPHTFRTLPAGARLDLWQRGVDRFSAEAPFASALIHYHALQLHRSVARKEPYPSLINAVEGSLEILIRRAGLDRFEVEACYRWIDLSDFVSLVGCRQFGHAVERHGYRAWIEQESLHINPFPFAGATRFAVDCREIDRRDYTSGAELASELARSTWTKFQLRAAVAG